VNVAEVLELEDHPQTGASAFISSQPRVQLAYDHSAVETKVLLVNAERRCRAQMGTLFEVPVQISKEEKKCELLESAFLICVPLSCETEIVAREVASFALEHQL
ncbi:unnamed protein product, partial [Amoebophrya sp. A25]